MEILLVDILFRLSHRSARPQLPLLKGKGWSFSFSAEGDILLLLHACVGGPSLLQIFQHHESKKFSQTSGIGPDKGQGIARRRKVVHRTATAHDKKLDRVL